MRAPEMCVATRLESQRGEESSAAAGCARVQSGGPYRNDLEAALAHAKRLESETRRLREKIVALRAHRAKAWRVRLRTAAKLGAKIVLVSSVMGGLAVGAWMVYERYRPFQCRLPEDHNTRSKVALLHWAAELHRLNSDATKCPELPELIGDYGPKSDLWFDNWGTLIDIRCRDDDIWVASAGPDRLWDTRDDIYYPEPPRHVDAR